MLSPIDPKIELPKLEAEILKYWQEKKIFEKSLQKDSPKGDWNFLDGPPFVTGMPHYGTLLSSIPKDVFGRLWTMKGYHVRRVWGWDGHGLPIENKVEGKLKIKRKKDIEEKIGVGKFIKECLSYVQEVSAEWEWYVDRIARWVDFKNAYKTWDKPYMESVLWVFKQIYDKGYIYKGLRVSLYCPHCATPISNFEVAMDADNYRDVTEPTAVFKYPLVDRPDTYLLAWSTTPWNKLATPALAVNPELTYVEVQEGTEKHILAKTTLKMLRNKPYRIVREFPGKDLIGQKFVPHYNYYKIDPGKRAFVVIGADFVTAIEGTGIVTIAAYGEEDLEVMQKENIQIVLHLDEEGKLKSEVPYFAGKYYLEVDPLVIEDLKSRNLIYRVDSYTHSVPHCWRCHERLIYAPQNAWYINIQELKGKMKKTNQKVNWYPPHFKEGRYLNSLEAAPDWCISRSRYWGSPVPVWECQCGQRFVPGSIAELEQATHQKISDLHKPGIDELKVKCQKCGQMSSRVPEVLDSWVEAGSAAFAERHFPFDVPEEDLNKFFPPDFIVEYTGQIRAWFYVLHVIATALYDSPAFKNVAVTGVILGTDGRKMSKNYGNYPDPKEMLLKYGGDGLRLYLLGSPVMKGEDILISETAYAEQLKVLRLLLNIYNFLATNAQADSWQPAKTLDLKTFRPSNILDWWLLSRFQNSLKNLSQSLESFDTADAISQAQILIGRDLSTWYLRRLRDRVGPTIPEGPDKKEAYQTLYLVLENYLRALAPLLPFLTEFLYRNLTGRESVHLADWPEPLEEKLDKPQLEKEMENAIKIASKIHAVRKESQIPVKVPLKRLEYIGPSAFSEPIVKIILAEVNADELIFLNTGPEYVVSADTGPKNQDPLRGQARDFVRQIQELRKKSGCRLADHIRILAPAWPKEFEGYIKRETLASEIKPSDSLKIEVI